MLAGGAGTAGAVTDGEDVTDGDPPSGLAGIADIELAGPADVGGALASGVLAGPDGDPDGDPDGPAPAWLRWLEQPTAVAASTTVRAPITVCDVVRIMLYPPACFTSSAQRPTFIVNRRLRPRES